MDNKHTKIFFRGMSTLLPTIKNRWTPIYYEHGNIVQENYSIKFCSVDNYHESIPVANISCILLGPGTTITHSAIVACSKTNTPIVWVGEDSFAFYASGVHVNNKCKSSRDHAYMYANVKTRILVSQRMYQMRFNDNNVFNDDIETLRGKEGYRIRELYKSLSLKYNVDWNGRNSSGQLFGTPTGINELLNIGNHYLYAIVLSAVCTLGYIPSLGFVHSDGQIPFVYDIADLYKECYTIEPAFKIYAEYRTVNIPLYKECMKRLIIKHKLLKRIPLDLKELIKC